jgi:hypothetical protein
MVMTREPERKSYTRTCPCVTSVSDRCISTGSSACKCHRRKGCASRKRSHFRAMVSVTLRMSSVFSLSAVTSSRRSSCSSACSEDSVSGAAAVAGSNTTKC